MLTKIKRLHKQTYPSGQHQWMSLYECDCGKNIERLETSVKNPDNSHCGCKTTNRHDLKYGKELESRWNGIRRRTENGFPSTDNTKSKCYENVFICEEWKNDFMSFYNWAIDNGFSPELHIDRKISNIGYEPSNCRWITQIENNRNGARSKITAEEAREILHLHGVYINIDIAEAYGITPSVVCNIAKGRLWSDVHAKYATEKNTKRANPRFLKPLVNYSKGSIDFDDF